MGDEPDYNTPLDEDQSVVKINASPVNGWLAIFLRQIALVGSSFATIFSFLSAGDIRGLFTYLGTHEFIAMTCLVITLAVSAWAYVKEWLHKKKLVLAATTPPSQVEITNLKGS